MGGFEVDHEQAVTYKQHARWALQYADRCFQKDFQFVFQIFRVMQKRQVCHSASLQIKRKAFQTLEEKISTLMPADLRQASVEEAQKLPFSNPSVQALRSQLTAV